MAAEPNVANIMTTSVVTVEPATSVTDVARLMVTRDISGVPVVTEGRVVGIVTETDIIARQMDVDPPAFGTFLDAIFRLPWDHSDEELRRVLATTAGELMSTEVQTVAPDASIADVASLMFKHGVNPVPVVDRDGRLIGIVSRSDIVRMLLRGDEAAEQGS